MNNDTAESSCNSEVPSDCKSLLDKLLDKLDDNDHRDEEDDLEEGELKDDDDDEEEDDEGENSADKDIAKSKESSSNDDSPVRPSSSSSSSPSSSSDSKEQSSSKSSSKIGSHHSSSSRNNNLSTDRYSKPRLSSSRNVSEDRYRIGREREREDPSEKAAKLISMRTKLLEARSREIELKFQKNKSLTLPLQPPPPLINSGSQRNVKMTITKPSISYNENPNPSYVVPEPIVESKKKVKSRQKSEEKEKEKEKKTKKKSKKKKKSSSKKHRKHKSSSVSKKSVSDSKTPGSQELELPYDDNLAGQGPKTPPDNHVLTLEDEQIEWPSHLIRMTMTQPSISYSVNPGSMGDATIEGKKDESLPRKRKSTSTSDRDRKKYRTDEKHSSISSSASQKTISPRNPEEGGLHRKYSPLKQTSVYETDLNSDHTWYYNYFMNSYEMDHNQAQHQAYAAVIATGVYENDVIEKWLKSRGLSKLAATDPEAQKQIYPVSLKAEIPSPSGSQHSSSTKPDHAGTLETNEQMSGVASIDRVITRIARNKFDRDSEERINHKSENSQEQRETKDSVMEVKVTIKAENVEELISSVRVPEVEAETAYETSQQTESKTEGSIEQLSAQTISEEDIVSLRPIKPKFTIIKSQKEIVLPNGHVLPAGTIQKIVHPYPRSDSEVLGPFFDLY